MGNAAVTGLAWSWPSQKVELGRDAYPLVAAVDFADLVALPVVEPAR
jgi:hypothetical protein